MTFYVDAIETWASGDWCHCWTDESDADLDSFAKALGLKLQWAQLSGGPLAGRFYHYDLRPGKRALEFLLAQSPTLRRAYEQVIALDGTMQRIKALD